MLPTSKSLTFRLLCAFWLIVISTTACDSKDNIVGRWDFETKTGRWDYRWMEFFDDGTYTDSWGNSRSWTLLSDGRLKLTASFDGHVLLFDIKISGDTMEITEEDGSSAVGTRAQK